MVKPSKEVKAEKWIVNLQPKKPKMDKEQEPPLTRTQKRRLQQRRTKGKIKGIMAMFEQSKRIERKLVRSSINSPKPEQATELSKELHKMVAKPTKELNVEAILAKPTEFIREGEYSENLLDNLLNNDNLLDDLQDD